MEKAGQKAGPRERFDVEKILRVAIPKALYVLSGFLAGLGGLPFGAYPFGFALLAAVNKNAVFVYAGLVAGCFVGFRNTASVLFLGIYTAELLLRILVRLTLDYPFGKGAKRGIREIGASLFGEAVGYRVLTATVCAFALSLCFLLGDGFLYYDLFGLFISIAIAPIAAFLLVGFFEEKGVRKEIGQLGIFALCVHGAASLTLYGVSLAAFGALFITFYVTQRHGFLKGLVSAIALGLIYSPALAPAFVFAALMSGVFMRLSPSLACFASFFAAVAWGFFVRGIYALDGFFAGVLSASVLYSVFVRVIAKEMPKADELKKDDVMGERLCTVLDESELDSVRLCEMNRRMSAIGGALEEMSAFFEDMKMKIPQKAELLRICRDAFESSCAGCPEFDRCRAEGNTNEAVRHFGALLESGRRLESADVGEKLVGRCTRLPDILDEINYNSGAIERELGGRAPAPDYKALSGLMSRTMEENGEFCIDGELSRRVCDRLESYKIGKLGVFVYGKRRRTVYIKAKDTEMLEEIKERVLDAVEEDLSFPIDRERASITRSAGGGVMKVSEARRLGVSCVTRQQRAKDEEEFCGDSMEQWENGEGRFFSLISDGMGSGREASAVARICTKFISSMLEVGEMNEELLLLLNGFLCGRCEGSLKECSATVDIMEIDLISGETEFFKSGAAPSYVFRDGSLFKLRSRTMPIGILDETDTKRFNFKLSEGDVVVMISDGVTGGREECPWLFDLLRQNAESAGLERTADLIMKYAVGHGSSDDISVAVMRIERA